MYTNLLIDQNVNNGIVKNIVFICLPPAYTFVNVIIDNEALLLYVNLIKCSVYKQ